MTKDQLAAATIARLIATSEARGDLLFKVARILGEQYTQFYTASVLRKAAHDYGMKEK